MSESESVEQQDGMPTSDKFGIAGIASGLIIPFIGIILSIIGLAKADEDKTIPAVGMIVSVMAWMIWFLAW